MKRRGISLIVLIITIVVIIILSTAIIVNLAQTNIIVNANEANVKQDFKTMQEELALYIADKYANTRGKFEADKLNADESSVTYTGEGTVDETSIKEILTSIKNNKYKVAIANGRIVLDESMDEQIKQWAKEAINSISTVIPSTPTEPEIPEVANPRYLLVEVNGYLENEDSAVINEIQIYDKELNKCEYTVLNELEYDSATGGKSTYWEDMRYWNYTNLSDNAFAYTSNYPTGNQNCTLFLSGDSGNANSWARFVIDLGKEVDIGQIRVSIGGYDELSPATSRTPKEISFYKINSFIDGNSDDSTYNNNVVQQNNDGLTLINKKEFTNILSTPTWIEFLDYDYKNCINTRYLLVEVNGYIENEDCAVINEIMVYNKYNEKIDYTVLNQLEYDSATGGKSTYWEDMRYWNYTNLSDNAFAYTSNYPTGNQNCTLFLSGDSGNANSWARFVIDLGEDVDIRQISLYVGGYDELSLATSRTPKEVSFYKVNNFIDGNAEDSTYNHNIIQQNNEGLSLIFNKQFEEICTTPTEFKLKFE